MEVDIKSDTEINTARVIQQLLRVMPPRLRTAGPYKAELAMTTRGEAHVFNHGRRCAAIAMVGKENRYFVAGTEIHGHTQLHIWKAFFEIKLKNFVSSITYSSHRITFEI